MPTFQFVNIISANRYVVDGGLAWCKVVYSYFKLFIVEEQCYISNYIM